jgi:NAD(P)-dependent dehydrogenase (short-subunit alcohol dehydrogenase family)
VTADRGRPRVVLVTGSSSGIGLATAIAFATTGDTVVASVREPGRAGALLEAAGARDLEVDVVQLDVTDDESVARCLADVARRHGRLDVLVNNAGTGFAGTLEELSLDDVRASMEVNFFGVVRLTKAVLPRMRVQGGGRIIAMSSIAGAFGQPFNDAYCAAKFAVEGLYESLQPVMATFGVYLSVVQPGPVAGEFWERSRGVAAGPPSGPYAELWERFLGVADAGRERPQPIEAIARLIVAIASAEHPKVRYQTSSAIEALVGVKLSDLSGERIAALTGGWLADRGPPQP